MEAALERAVDRLEAIEAVQQLMARYHQCGDGWAGEGTHRDPAAMAELFTEDGVWDVTARKPPPTGRVEIAALAKDLRAVPWIVHTYVSPIIEVEGDAAKAVIKGIMHVKHGGRHDPTIDRRLGIYHVLAARTEDGWKFRSLTWEPVTHPLLNPPT